MATLRTTTPELDALYEKFCSRLDRYDITKENNDYINRMLILHMYYDDPRGLYCAKEHAKITISAQRDILKTDIATNFINS